MKIERIETIVVDTGKGRTWAFVEIATDEGLVGVGEASQSRLDAAVVAQVKALEPLYVGHDPFALIEARARLLKRPDAGRTLHVAVSSLEQALWDIVGKAVGRPVHELLGGAVREEIPLYANVAMAAESWTPEPVARWAKAAADDGFAAVKFNILPIDAGRGPLRSHLGFAKAMDNAVAVVREARAAVGPHVRLLTDWSLAIGAKDAVRLADALEPYDLLWIEALRARRSRRARGLPPAHPPAPHGRRAASQGRGFPRAAQARAADCIMPDVKWLGGILECRKVAAMAEAFDVEIAPHNMSGPVATAASAAFSPARRTFSSWNIAAGVPRLARRARRRHGARREGDAQARVGAGTGARLEQGGCPQACRRGLSRAGRARPGRPQARMRPSVGAAALLLSGKTASSSAASATAK
ncbi:MAG: mandelate racemase/muconate lactonizing enzyme family protein [Alphaproteobacteria bacterium]|nr:mandelate racemase/muconate lactonizing enzyme family protein [Alphaproteobacteria bacterium]